MHGIHEYSQILFKICAFEFKYDILLIFSLLHYRTARKTLDSRVDQSKFICKGISFAKLIGSKTGHISIKTPVFLDICKRLLLLPKRKIQFWSILPWRWKRADEKRRRTELQSRAKGPNV